jgi:hypothetical protein
MVRWVHLLRAAAALAVMIVHAHQSAIRRYVSHCSIGVGWIRNGGCPREINAGSVDYTVRS